MPHVLVMPLVSQALGEILPRGPLLTVLNRMYDQLENHYERYRTRRYSARPDDYFDYILYFANEQGEWSTFRFTIDDKQAQGYLIVAAVSYCKGKARPG